VGEKILAESQGSTKKDFEKSFFFSKSLFYVSFPKGRKEGARFFHGIIKISRLVSGTPKRERTCTSSIPKFKRVRTYTSKCSILKTII
jgi:hypothetical protein